MVYNKIKMPDCATLQTNTANLVFFYYYLHFKSQFLSEIRNSIFPSHAALVSFNHTLTSYTQRWLYLQVWCIINSSICNILCPIGKTDDAKVSEKGRMSPSSNMVQHSSSDAGRSSGDEAKKTPAGRVPTSTFGFKKPNGVHGPATVVSTSSITLMTASGATITSGSATLGKIPKSSGLLVGGRGSLKGALDGLLPPPQEDGTCPPVLVQRCSTEVYLDPPVLEPRP